MRFTFCFILVFSCYANGNSQQFVRTVNSDFYLNGKNYYFIGTNAYYCVSRCVYNDTNSIIEIFSKLKNNNMTVVRIWGFYDGNNTVNPAIIQYAPGKYNETALRALDYVMKKAGEYNLKVIITLVNNWEDYGGMNQYLRWLGGIGTNKNILSVQNIIIRKKGNDNAYYTYFINNNLTHDDFYTNPKVREWYKEYTSMLIQRINTYTNVQYKNDPTIFSWELANEPESSDKTGQIVNAWIKEMSAFIKSIDQNHLVGSGEEGFDIYSNLYSDSYLNYCDNHWLFDGQKGISFYENTKIKDIDYGTAHLYNYAWGFDSYSGNIWIQDHKNICRNINKPFLLGEFGSLKEKYKFYDSWMNSVYMSETNGSLFWLIGFDSMPDYDGFTIYYPKNQNIFDMFREYSIKINIPQRNNFSTERVSLIFPNPASGLVNFRFSLEYPDNTTFEIFNILGQMIGSLEKHFYLEGIHTKIINISSLSSGIYYLRIYLNGEVYWRKLCVMRRR